MILLAARNPYVSDEEPIFCKLVKAGEERSYVTLPFQLHMFLVDCLVEHLYDPEIVHEVLALNFLQCESKLGEQGNVKLKRVGDEALILAGLFPERALRLNVSSRYFRIMGQSSYSSLAAKFHVTGRPERGEFYDKVARHFELLEKVLDAARVRTSAWEFFQKFRARLQ